MSKIGLYNSKVEGCECLKDCNLILDNFEDLQKNIKEKDIYIFEIRMRCILVKVAAGRMNTIYS